LGLFEKAKHLADAQLRALLEPGAAVPDEVVKRAILELDGYRRELAAQLAKHANEEAFLANQIADRAAKVALWRERRTLAQERARTDLADAAAARAEQEAAERAAIEKKRAVLQSAIANLTVSLGKVERTLKLLREKKRRLEATRRGGAPLDAGKVAGEESGLVRFPVLPADADALEEEFRRLEHEEVTRRLEGPGASGAAPLRRPPDV
jgi:hypothetical protein